MIERTRAMMPFGHQIARLLVGTMVAILSAGQGACAQDDIEQANKAEVDARLRARAQFEFEVARRTVEIINRWSTEHFGELPLPGSAEPGVDQAKPPR